ncbi:Kinase superfamily protein [Hibiscus syriacus]|uniref:Kinase superfamily protein n=1 Tax=Hibiscus syriacus TaxID=106335 RepID=A0A6A3AL76_HIBSY|nr:Kinase superfamily protein [Hibiscus syriacus]
MATYVLGTLKRPLSMCSSPGSYERDCMRHVRPNTVGIRGHPRSYARASEAIRPRPSDRGHPTEAIRLNYVRACEDSRASYARASERASKGRSPGVHGDLQGRQECMATYKVARIAWRPTRSPGGHGDLCLGTCMCHATHSFSLCVRRREAGHVVGRPEGMATYGQYLRIFRHLPSMDYMATFGGCMDCMATYLGRWECMATCPHIGRQVLRATSLLDGVGRHARPATYQVAMHAQRPSNESAAKRLNIYSCAWIAWRPLGAGLHGDLPSVGHSSSYLPGDLLDRHVFSASYERLHVSCTSQHVGHPRPSDRGHSSELCEGSRTSYLNPVLVLSVPYVFPEKYFINCGSDSPETQGVKKFVGDENPNSFSVANGKPITHTTRQSSSNSVLYQTARFSTDPFSYELDDTGDEGLHVVRLHFFPFAHLGDALFNVTASSKSLLSNFSVRNTTSFPVIKDFLVPISSFKFKIHFIPANQSSMAFVNAIEVFLVPNLKDNRTHLSPAGRLGLYQGLPSQLLRTVHRVAFGSQTQSITDSEVVASEWVADRDYIVVGNWATNYPYQTIRLRYDEQFPPNSENYNAASQNFTPDRVYRTCKEVRLHDNQTSNSHNITWHFNVSKNAQHFVRVHFCDIISQSPNTVQFGLFIYNNFTQQIDPYQYNIINTAVPFYLDFVVDSGESDFISVGVVAWANSTGDKFAYLNGLEIMEFITEPGLELEIRGPKRKTLVYIIVGSVAGFVVICCTLLVAFLLFKKRRKAKALEPMASYGTLPFRGASPYIGISSKSGHPPPVPNLNLKLKMPFAEILEATKNFDAKFLIGEGGFGKVYKGILRNGLQVAVKRSESKHGQGLPEFQTEVMILSKIRHRHLVSLVGYCDEGSEMILVYEFMEKGTLRDHLYKMQGNPEKPSSLSLLTWRQRLEICIGAAKGLHYLHTGSDGGIIHRDVKSTNILLGEEYVAKVADFGLSKSGLLDPDGFSTGIKGSFGYLDPEYFRCLQFTEKSDVYSFGVVLLEVLCARPAIINSHWKEEINLGEWGMICEIVEKCLRPTGSSRPTMLDICWDLEYTLQLQQTAVHREPHEDSTIDSSFNMSSRPFQRLPSNNYPIEKVDVPLEKDDGSDITESGVFSQLKIDDGK